MRTQRFALLAAAFAAACSGDSRPQTTPATPPAAERPVARIDGTPEGGLVEWVADMQAGLDTVVVVAQRDRDAAQRVVLDVYVNRQEWLERYYGKYGALQADTASALGTAVMDAEARFHTLLTLVASEGADSAAIATAVSSVRAELGRVLDEAGRTAVRPVPGSEGMN